MNIHPSSETRRNEPVTALTGVFDAECRAFQSTPGLRHYFEPKRIPTPQGYHPFRLVGGGCYSMMNQCAHHRTLDQQPSTIQTTAYTIFYQLLRYRLPVYFVAETLARAVAATSPPPDFVLCDLHWPMPAFVLGFPPAFMKEYVGADLCYINCALLENGEYHVPVVGCPTIVVPRSKVGIHFFLRQNGTVGSQVSAYHLDDKLEGVFDRYAYVDFTGASAEQQMEDSERLNKVTALVYKLLLVLGTQPALLEHGVCTRPASVKKGRVRDALWSPNFIGARYQPPEHSLGGTHASPRMHWRRGHIRRQPHGPQMLLRKLMWIEPVLVGGNHSQETTMSPTWRASEVPASTAALPNT